jgi:ferredoxin-NADP reductase
MALVKKYRTIVKEIEHPLPDIYIVTLASQDGRYRYKPGQFLHLALDQYDPSKQWPESRCFSIQTNPREEYIKITYSVKGDYTKRMARELTPAQTVWVKLPYGDLFSTIDPKARSIFIAGGTGVTPCLSLFTDEKFKAFQSPVLYFGARSERYNIYKKEFDKACKINSTFRIVAHYEDAEGFLNIEHIAHQHAVEDIFYLSGPPLMTKSFKKHLLDNNVPESNIKTDDWE